MLIIKYQYLWSRVNSNMNVCVIIRLALVDIPDKMCEDLSYDRTAK